MDHVPSCQPNVRNNLLIYCIHVGTRHKSSAQYVPYYDISNRVNRSLIFIQKFEYLLDKLKSVSYLPPIYEIAGQRFDSFLFSLNISPGSPCLVPLRVNILYESADEITDGTMHRIASRNAAASITGQDNLSGTYSILPYENSQSTYISYIIFNHFAVYKDNLRYLY
jgi:hypothetical protein